MQTAIDKHEVGSWPLFYDAQGGPICQNPSRIVPSTTVIVYRPDGGYMQTIWWVLCHKRLDNGMWGFVGGAQEVGESLRECAVRETYEETGLYVKIERMVCIDSDPSCGSIMQYPDGNIIQYTNVTFMARCPESPNDALHLNTTESSALAWYPTSSLPQPFSTLHAWRLQQALAINQHPPVR